MDQFGKLHGLILNLEIFLPHVASIKKYFVHALDFYLIGKNLERS